MIHVCSLSRLHRTVEDTGAQHVVTLLKDVDLVRRPDTIVPANHLVLGMDDITEQLNGYVAPADEHVTKLIAFVRRWNRTKPLVIHCYAGISRSTAGAFVVACALNPQRDELSIAQALRRASASSASAYRVACRSRARAGRSYDLRDRNDWPRSACNGGGAFPAGPGMNLLSSCNR